MAKTGFWLKGANGKLAGSALQKGCKREQNVNLSFIHPHLARRGISF